MPPPFAFHASETSTPVAPLNRDEKNFQIAAFGVIREISYNEVKELSLDKELVKSYKIVDIEYVAKKIVGFIYDKDLSSSMLYSILKFRHHDEEVVELIGTLFVDYLIFNYYSVVEYLTKQRQNAPAELKKILDDIISRGEHYYNAYNNLKALKELQPSELRLKHMNTIQNKRFRKSYEENEKTSHSFLSMLTTIHFRSGKSSFGKFQEEYSARMEPKLISHSTEMPRGEYIDPVGQAQFRLECRFFTRRK